MTLRFAVFVASLFGLSLAAQQTLHVPSQFPTIQAAINGAVNGDTVLVGPGTYFERIDFQAKDIAVSSTAGALQTTINGQGMGTVVAFQFGSNGARFDGFTITGGHATYNGGIYSNYGGGIRCWNASPTILNCVVSYNTADDAGGGISVVGGSPIIQNCKLLSNNASGGGNLWVSAASVPIVENTLISGGYAYGSGGVAVYSNAPGEGAMPILINCTITGNTAYSGQGGGIGAVQANTLTLRNCIVWGNNPPVFWTTHPTANGTIAADHCLLEAIATTETACIHVAPGFVSNSPDFAISSSSPCIDAGLTAYSNVGGDLEGDPRVVGETIDIGCDEFFGMPGPGAEGSVGATFGGPYDILFINGSAGGAPRRVDVPLATPFTMSVTQPPTYPYPTAFVIVGYIGVPGPSEVTPLPYNIGTLCFPSPHLTPGTPGLFVLTNNFGPDMQLVSSTPTPWSITVNGLPFPFQFALQGVIQQDPGAVRTTNGILVNIQ